MYCVYFTFLFLLSAQFAPRGITTAAADDHAVAKGSRQEQIMFWEEEIRRLRDGNLALANQRLALAEHALKEAKKKSGWIFTSERDKARIKLLDEEFEKQKMALATLQKEEEMMLAKVKPLYGLLSRHFAQEQRNAIVNAISEVQRMSYDSAWYDSLFTLHEAETLTDIIVGFLFKWMVGYIFMYPFAVLFYAFWTVPWSIYAYSSGTSDLFLGVVAWCASVTVMLLPLLALVAGFWYIRRNYGTRVAEALRAAREREGGRRRD